MLFASKEKKLLLASYVGELNNVKKLLSRKPINVDATNREGVTPLMAAVDHGHFKVVELLIEEGAYVNMANNKGTFSPKFIIHTIVHIGGVPLIYVCRLDQSDVGLSQRL
jgi:ankyrin repeat protein